MRSFSPASNSGGAPEATRTAARLGTRSSSITSIMQKSPNSGTRIAQIASKVSVERIAGLRDSGDVGEDLEASAGLALAQGDDRKQGKRRHGGKSPHAYRDPVDFLASVHRLATRNDSSYRPLKCLTPLERKITHSGDSNPIAHVLRVDERAGPPVVSYKPPIRLTAGRSRR